MQFRSWSLHSTFCTEVQREKPRKEISLYFRNKECFICTNLFMWFSHTTIKVSPVYTTSSYNPRSYRFCFQSLRFSDWHSFVHDCYKSWVKWHSFIEFLSIFQTGMDQNIGPKSNQVHVAHHTDKKKFIVTNNVEDGRK